MQISIETLRRALETVAPAVPKKTSMPALKGVLIGGGYIAATNLEQYIRLSLPKVSGEPMLLPHQYLVNLVKSIPGHVIADFTQDGGQVRLSAGRTRAVLNAMDRESFPPFPEIEVLGEATLDGNALVRGLDQARRYAATEDSRPVLTTVCLEFGEPAEVCGADGFRLMYRPLSFDLKPVEGGPERLLIPGSTVDLLAKVWAKAGPGPTIESSGTLVQLLTARHLLRFRYGKAQAVFEFGNVTIATQLVDGAFPKYRQLIPAGGDSWVHVQAEDLALAVRETSTVAKEGSGIVRLRWGGDEFPDTIAVAARSEDAGEIEVAVLAKPGGEPGRIAFNLKYLHEYLNGRGGIITIQTSGTSHPGLFTSKDGASVVVMPMAVQWEGDPHPDPEREADEHEAPEGIDAEDGQSEEPTNAAEVPETQAGS